MGAPDVTPDPSNLGDMQVLASQDRAQHPDPDPAAALSWELCAHQVADNYRVCVDRAGRTGRLRYVAVAHNLSVRPYAVVTSDPAELLQALGCPDIAAPAPPARRHIQ
jgi:hypothetical protein